MEPLQLEESNDASDYATMLLSKAAAESTSSLQTISEVAVPTPVKSDISLENLLINECQRLDDATPSEPGPSNTAAVDPTTQTPTLSKPTLSIPMSNPKLKEKFIDLFGEDSSFDNAAPNKSLDDSIPAAGKLFN